MTDISKQRKRELLKESKLLKETNVFESLSFKQLCKLIWWEQFDHKKIDKFYEMLQVGKAAKFAFRDAQQCQRNNN